MTQKWYLRNTTATVTVTAGNQSTALEGARTLGANNATGTDETRSLNSAKGAAQTSLTKAGDASTAERMNYLCRFTSPAIQAGTYGSGTWGIALALNESNANANSFLNVSIYFWNPAGSVRGFIYDSGTDIGTEWANAETGEVNNITGANVTASEGDVLVIEIWRHCTTQGMATAYNQIVYFDGTTDPTDGTATSDAASYINAPADIPEYVAPVTTIPGTPLLLLGVG